MTRILYMSDLHIEMERWRLSVPGWQDFLARHRDSRKHPSGDARKHPLRGPLLMGYKNIDLVVLAGDIHTGLRGVVYAEQLADYFEAPVVYVAGNHEYYHQYMDLLDPALLSAGVHSSGRVNFLENSIASFTFAGRRLHVLGCTMWTDYQLYDDQDAGMDFAARHMNDFRLIRRVTSFFQPEHALERHARSRVWLRENIARLRLEEPGAKIVAVTHHAPHPALLGRRTGRIGPSYASNLLPEFSSAPPDLWIHGHTHLRHDSVLEGIRVVSAPRGYVSYEGDAALAFRPGVLEL
jgi:predicted phosphodiesterase